MSLALALDTAATEPWVRHACVVGDATSGLVALGLHTLLEGLPRTEMRVVVPLSRE